MFVTIIVWLAVFIIFLAGVCLSFIAYPFDLWGRRSGDLIHLVSRYFGKAVLLVSGIKVQVKGMENISREGVQLICANHQSLFDIMIMDSVLPIQFRFLVKKELYSAPLLGPCLRMEQQISVDRQNLRKGMEIIRGAGDMLRRGRSILVFPEGTRSPDGQVRPFRKGSLLIATTSHVPVVPVSINGSYSILAKGSFRLRPGRVTVVISRPIRTDGLSRAEQKELAERVRRIIIESMEG